jgi:hypothetical protein
VGLRREWYQSIGLVFLKRLTPLDSEKTLEELFSRSKTSLLFKGLGSFKYFFAIGGYVEHLRPVD